MRRELLASKKKETGLSLDPRTKLALLITIALFVSVSYTHLSGEVCHTPKELFDLLADDYRTYLEIELTKGKREVTEDDEREADALCKQYLERWKEEQK